MNHNLYGGNTNTNSINDNSKNNLIENEPLNEPLNESFNESLVILSSMKNKRNKIVIITDAFIGVSSLG